ANYSSTYVPYALSRNIDLCSDFDGDLVRDLNDLDDDNDGVLDAVESPSCFFQSTEITNGIRTSTGIGITTEIPMNATYNVPSKLVDGDETTGASQYAVQFVNGTSIVNKEVYKFEFPVPIELTRINLRFVNTNSHFNTGTTIKLQGGNDNANWTDLNTGVTYDVTTDNNIIAPYWTANTPNEQFTVTQNQGKYRFYRLFGTAGAVNSNGLPNEVYFMLSATYQASLNPKTSCSADTDRDQILNHRDLDSDADGCSDAKEANATTSSVSNFTFSGDVGTNGLINTKETSPDNGAINYVSYYDNALNNTRNGCTDTDNDGVGDLIDIDDDNDGVLDTAETSSCATIGRDLTALTFNGQAITSVTSTSIATANSFSQGLGWRSSYSSQTLPLPVSLTFKASSSSARDVMFGLMPANNTQNPTSWSDGGYKFY
ncbi:MAG: hypothetical protein EBU66_20610, partial [Bacteroidetes bacterium]|nr:hypothetical protein [Bacteroidota bacterium]